METPKEYYYTYYSYEEWGRGYIGSRTCKCLPEKDVRYFGSFRDKTFRPTQKIILKGDYATREEAYVDEIILQEYYKVAENPHFANRAYQTSTKFCLSKERAIENGKKVYELGIGVHGQTKEQMIENGRKSGKLTAELGLGVHGQTKEQMTENGKKGGSIAGKKTYELGLGLHGRTKEQMTEDGRKGGEISGRNLKELGRGIFGLTPEQKSEISRKNGQKLKELGKGIFALTPEQKSENSKKIASQRWMCLETGHITSAGPLARYQKARGIDTTRRKRVG